jgi:isopenicillin N synthase-like dioxygenase
MVTKRTTLPVVDIQLWRTGSPSDQLRFATDVREICHELGFFYLVGHGVEPEFLERYFTTLKAFFSLPQSIKSTIDKRNSPYFRGWEREGAELTNNRPDIREQLDVSTENLSYPVDVTPPYLRLDGPNQWLDETVLPGFRDLVTEFFQRMSGIASELLEVLAVGFELPRSHFRDLFGERPLSLAKLIRYPATPAGQAGVNEHHDAGFLTLLLQHGVGGLQALAPDDSWIDIQPMPEAFVVNLGEMLQEMTGNYVVAATHRVIAAEERFSSAYFHGPDLRTPLERLTLSNKFAKAVASSPRHANAGFMAKREELLAGKAGTASDGAGVYGQQLWNYYLRSYPEIVRSHHHDIVFR